MEPTRRPIKSYVLRQGRLTRGQQQALDRLWDAYGVDYAGQALDLDSLYGRTAKRVLEIGFGNGDSVFRQAASSPDTDHLGIEVHRPGVGRLLRLAGEAGLTNLRVINHDAVEVMRHQIPDRTLDCVQLFFPDPWHKKRHHKRRIVNADFAQLVRRKLKPGGTMTVIEGDHGSAYYYPASPYAQRAIQCQIDLQAAGGDPFAAVLCRQGACPPHQSPGRAVARRPRPHIPAPWG